MVVVYLLPAGIVPVPFLYDKTVGKVQFSCSLRFYLAPLFAVVHGYISCRCRAAASRAVFYGNRYALIARFGIHGAVLPVAFFKLVLVGQHGVACACSAVPRGYGEVCRVVHDYLGGNGFFNALPLCPAFNDNRFRRVVDGNVAVAGNRQVNAPVFQLGKDVRIVIKAECVVKQCAVLFPARQLVALAHFERGFRIGFEQGVPRRVFVHADRVRPQYGASSRRRYAESDFDLCS